MYNAHRGMVPAPSSRLTELLDQVRAEFDNQQNRTVEYDQQSKFVSVAQVCRMFSRCHVPCLCLKLHFIAEAGPSYFSISIPSTISFEANITRGSYDFR